MAVLYIRHTDSFWLNFSLIGIRWWVRYQCLVIPTDEQCIKSSWGKKNQGSPDVPGRYIVYVL